MNKVWLIWWSTGSYSDHREDVIKIFDSKEKAEAFVKEIEEKLSKFGIQKDDLYGFHGGDWDAMFKVKDAIGLYYDSGSTSICIDEQEVL